jgi:hypothetical protein
MINADHVQSRNPSVIAQINLDPGIDGLQDRIGRKRRRDKDHCRVATSLTPCFNDRIKNGQAFCCLAPFSRCDTPTICVPYSNNRVCGTQPTLPVMPWQITRVFLLTKMLMVLLFLFNL